MRAFVGVALLPASVCWGISFHGRWLSFQGRNDRITAAACSEDPEKNVPRCCPLHLLAYSLFFCFYGFIAYFSVPSQWTESVQYEHRNISISPLSAAGISLNVSAWPRSSFLSIMNAVILTLPSLSAGNWARPDAYALSPWLKREIGPEMLPQLNAQARKSCQGVSVRNGFSRGGSAFPTSSHRRR